VRVFHDVRRIPHVPAIYVFYSRDSNARGRNPYAVYVGLTGNLNDRLIQHLWRQDSSVTTGTSAVVLNTNYITEVRWWTIPEFTNSHVLQAAEEIAFQRFDPVLRDRGRSSRQAMKLLADDEFCARMNRLFDEEPSGTLAFVSLEETFQRVELLEQRVAELGVELARLREVLSQSR
jgi:hypothetical protein